MGKCTEKEKCETYLSTFYSATIMLIGYVKMALLSIDNIKNWIFDWILRTKFLQKKKIQSLVQLGVNVCG